VNQIVNPILCNPSFPGPHQNETVQKRILKDKIQLEFIRQDTITILMTFNEQNTVEHFIIYQLTGGNLNAVQGNVVKEDAVEYDTVKWKYY